MFDGLLTAIVFLPALAAVAIALVLRGDRTVRLVAAGAMAVDFLLTVLAWLRFDPSVSAPQLVDKLGQYDTAPWVPGLNATYYLGVDGLSLPLLVLTALLGMCAVLASWHVTLRVREYHVLLLVLTAGVQGVFVSLDLFLFFLFWEVELVPMYFLISIWGSGRKEYSAMKFLIYTVFGSALMLVGILLLRLSAGTFDMPALIEQGQAGLIEPAFLSLQAIFFLLFFAFAVKLPVWPLHTWLPDAHTDAPTAVSIMLAGILLKMGGYGMLRLNVGIFPDVAQDVAPLLAAFAVINVIYGALIVFRQTDLKRLVAYSSVSHMGLVLLGVASMQSLGLSGAALQMFSHGIITGLLFLLVGLLYDNAHTRHIPDLGGLASKMPVVAVVFLLAGLASLGLPLLSGFVAELIVFLGSYSAQPLATVLVAFGIVLTAGYILWTLERTLFGPELPRFAEVRDAKPVDVLAMLPLVAAIVLVGVYPALLADIFKLGIAGILPG
ncbi:MAG: NADH-quinone oxidoreductase subunit M [Chloroflexi bacterium]|nr:NADH-quinone oxidoreductase subunit M [Chloroflexota bacterium]